ncbi:FecR family protein [Phenylobacterium sp.]|jgi:transmembrane sensor|uniref:FecR family protein n=1 Tax=Phenylobacterium sp. TaxID=1871053 RepID=UPI002F407776
MTEQARREQAETDASAWLARLSGEHVVEQDGHAFEAWLAADPENRPAYERALAPWHEFEIRAETVLEELTALDRRRAMRARSRWSGWMAGGGVAVAAAAALVILPPSLREAPAQTYQTARAQHQKIKLADGSTIDMDAETRLTVRISGGRRQVALANGQAIFNVIHDPSRPFTVEAAGREIRDVGTQFEVRDRQDGLTVTVAQGRVEVRPGASGSGQTYLLTPGERLAIGQGGAEAVRLVDPQETFSWRSGRLVYRNQPLQDVVADLNREFAQQIDIGDPALARIPITGVIVLDDPHAVATRLSLMLPVKAVPSAQGLTLIRK